MNTRMDFSNLGGFPFTQFTLKEMQDNYRGQTSAIAKLLGDKVILYGVEIIGSNVTDGWISYNGEMLPFVGGPLNTKVVVTEAPVYDRTFEDTAVYPSYFSKTATCALLGDFDFSELIRVSTLSNIWLPNDIKQKYVDNAYIAANFDINGYGLGVERGWRILTAVYPDTAGKVFVNRDPADVDLDEAGKMMGTKTGNLTVDNLAPFSFTYKRPRTDVIGAQYEPNSMDSGGDRGLYEGDDVSTNTLGTNTPHSKMQPSFVMLTLIKL